MSKDLRTLMAWWFKHPHLHHRTYAVIHMLGLIVALIYHSAAVVYHVHEDRRADSA